MSAIKKPTCDELMELDPIYRKSDDSWRHGSYVTAVYEISPGVFWQASYCRSGDGETNELREGLATICQVRPVEKMIIIYELLV